MQVPRSAFPCDSIVPNLQGTNVACKPRSVAHNCKEDKLHAIVVGAGPDWVAILTFKQERRPMADARSRRSHSLDMMGRDWRGWKDKETRRRGGGRLYPSPSPYMCGCLVLTAHPHQIRRCRRRHIAAFLQDSALMQAYHLPQGAIKLGDDMRDPKLAGASIITITIDTRAWQNQSCSCAV